MSDGVWSVHSHSFCVYFIIFTHLSPGLMCGIVLADFTVGSFVTCKHQQAFGPSLSGKGTELEVLESSGGS